MSDMLQRVNAALDGLRLRYNAPSDVALIRALRQQHGVRTSTHVLHKLRTGDWTDANQIIICAFLDTSLPKNIVTSQQDIPIGIDI